MRIIGERDDLSSDIRSLLEEAEDLTRGNDGLTLVVAFNYGARQEIARAARRLAIEVAAGRLAADAITPEMLARHLDAPDIPDPDVIIRTSGEQRLSNFLLWQAAYSELVFVPINWPDFDRVGARRARLPSTAGASAVLADWSRRQDRDQTGPARPWRKRDCRGGCRRHAQFYAAHRLGGGAGTDCYRRRLSRRLGVSGALHHRGWRRSLGMDLACGARHRSASPGAWAGGARGGDGVSWTTAGRRRNRHDRDRGGAGGGSAAAAWPRPHSTSNPAAWSAAGVVYAGLVLLGPAILRGDPQLGFAALLFLFATVWATDIFAYLVGRSVGGPLLWPALSPKKTWAGAIGGLVGGVAAGGLVAYASAGTGPVAAGVLGLVLSIVAQAGDLFESAVKRRFGAKDASSLIPGHGGVMDRLDGFLVAAVVAALIGSLHQGMAAPAQGLLVW